MTLTSGIMQNSGDTRILTSGQIGLQNDNSAKQMGNEFDDTLKKLQDLLESCSDETAPPKQDLNDHMIDDVDSIGSSKEHGEFGKAARDGDSESGQRSMVELSTPGKDEAENDSESLIEPASGSDYTPWTESDEWLLRLGWGTVQISFLAQMLKRSICQTRHRALDLRARRSGNWSAAERKLLKKLYRSRRNIDLEVTLMRSSADIALVAKQMHLSKADTDVTNSKLAANLIKRHLKDSTKPRSSQPKIQRASMPRWTPKEVAQLQAMYRDHDNQSIAIALGRSVTSIANKAWQLGIAKSAEQLTKIGRTNVSQRHNKND